MAAFSVDRSLSLCSVFSDFDIKRLSLTAQRWMETEDVNDVEEEEEISEEESQEEVIGELEFEPLPLEFWFQEKSSDDDDLRMKSILSLDLSKEFDLDKSFHGLPETEMYHSICKELHVTPIGNYENRRIANTFDASLRALESRGLLALCRALEKNSCVTELNLSKNCIDGEAIRYLEDLMKRNCFITNVDLSCNRVGNGGAYPIRDMLKTAAYLTHLNLSSNNLTVQHIRVIAKGIEEAKILQVLDLSRNFLSNTGAAIMGSIIANNYTITKLDLSWNEIYGRGASLLMTALTKNCTLEILKLACNGFRDVNSVAVSTAIAKNTNLLELDLTSNRITGQGVIHIAKALKKNNFLEILKLAKNPMDAKSALFLLSNGKMRLKELDLSGVLVSKEFLKMARIARRNREFDFTVKYGGPLKGLCNTRLLSTGEMRTNDHPLEVIRNSLWNRNIDIKDILFDAEGPIERHTFIELFRKSDCGISEYEVADLYDALDKEGGVNIDRLLNELDYADEDVPLE